MPIGQNSRSDFKHETDTISFGKHEGKSIRWLIEHDPSYVIWLNDEKIATFTPEMLDKAYDNDWDELSWGDLEY